MTVVGPWPARAVARGRAARRLVERAAAAQGGKRAARVDCNVRPTSRAIAAARRPGSSVRARQTRRRPLAPVSLERAGQAGSVPVNPVPPRRRERTAAAPRRRSPRPGASTAANTRPPRRVPARRPRTVERPGAATTSRVPSRSRPEAAPRQPRASVAPTRAAISCASAARETAARRAGSATVSRHPIVRLTSLDSTGIARRFVLAPRALIRLSITSEVVASAALADSGPYGFARADERSQRG